MAPFNSKNIQLRSLEHPFTALVRWRLPLSQGVALGWYRLHLRCVACGVLGLFLLLFLCGCGTVLDSGGSRGKWSGEPVRWSECVDIETSVQVCTDNYHITMDDRTLPQPLGMEGGQTIEPMESETEPGSEPEESRLVEWPYLTVDLVNRVVEIDGYVSINAGWLEQVICTPPTRTHESIIVTPATPSHIHAALLLLGLEPGRPGRWYAEVDESDGAVLGYRVEPPVGPMVRATVVYESNGQPIEVPINEWIRDHHTGLTLPDEPWVFAGSVMAEDQSGREVYAADHSGSIMGLVTFGDEVLGWSEVLPDAAAVRAPEWEANTNAMPEIGAAVVVRLWATSATKRLDLNRDAEAEAGGLQSP